MRRKSVFISGAGRGIGRAIAERFLEEGYIVGAYTRSGHFEWGKDVEDNLYQGQVDVADPESYKAAMEDFMSHTGGQLDILVNNAGVAVMGEFENQKYEDEKALFDVNVMGCVNGVHVALPYLKDTKDSQIVNISSGASFTGTPDLAVYSAAKFAIKGLTEALDIELMKYGIRVIDVNPMFVKTDMVMDGVKAGVDVPIFKTSASPWCRRMWLTWCTRPLATALASAPRCTGRWAGRHVSSATSICCRMRFPALSPA